MGVLGLTEAELWMMSPRAFTNKLKGHKLTRDREELMHSELIFAMLGPHMKKADRDKAYAALEKSAKTKVKTKPKTKHDPIEFWGEIDKRSGKTVNGKPKTENRSE